ncbi:hypothetical protein KI387_018775, partial [Taxus chinensis]
CLGNVNSECAVVDLMETLLAFHKKLKNMKISPGALTKIFDKYNCSKSEKPNHGVEQKTGERIYSESYLYKSAEGARVACDRALSKPVESSILDEILPWCSVKVNPALEDIELEVEIQGIMARDHVTTALGFCIDHPLVIHLTFGSTTWSAKEASGCVDFFGCVEVLVETSPTEGVQIGASIEKVVDKLDEKIKNYITDTFSASRMWQYGPNVLVRKFVKEFFHCCQIGENCSLHVMGRVAESDNIFVALLIFLGTWLKNLRNWCVVCRKQIPELSRLWYCESELCLYRFEELCIGASVLQELQNSELIDLELTLAAAATRSTNRDVFEPFPAFLLKRQEIRKRSGFFSNKEIRSGEDISNETVDHLVNKNLDIIKRLIDSFPPLSEMQQCSNEIELVLKLGIPWVQKNRNPSSVNKISSSQEEYAQIIWLPYKILRYVLFTNRLSLRLLQDGHRLDLHGPLYQFAVFYNAESEQKFEQRRKTEGSFFAFHGSSLSNWYSIIRLLYLSSKLPKCHPGAPGMDMALIHARKRPENGWAGLGTARNGLRCLSKTRYMSTGKVYGDGIYFSTDISVALAYSKSIPWRIHGKTKEYTVLAVCEILSGQKYLVEEKYLVVPPKNENDIAIRYLLVFKGKDISTGTVSVTDGHILTGKTNLPEHYKQLKRQYIQNVRNRGVISYDQRLALLQKRRLNTEHPMTP